MYYIQINLHSVPHQFLKDITQAFFFLYTSFLSYTKQAKERNIWHRPALSPPSEIKYTFNKYLLRIFVR